MKRLLTAIILTLCLAVPVYAIDVPLNTTAHVYFSPNGGCTEAIVREIDKAKSEILVQAYTFTSGPIANSLVRAKNSGIHVEIILDRSNRKDKNSAGYITAYMGIPTYIDSQYSIAHNKVMIIDRETVITGSFNFTMAAEEYNAENLLILKSRELAKTYIDNWNYHKRFVEPSRRFRKTSGRVRWKRL